MLLAQSEPRISPTYMYIAYLMRLTAAELILRCRTFAAAATSRTDL